MKSNKPCLGHALLAAALALGAAQAMAAATIVINNINAAGVGFNDPTPAVPVGGNTGTTLGQQRLNAFQYAANIWGATLTSSVPILINASFEPLTCTATSAVLGSAGATFIFNNFAGAQRLNTWYPYALTNKISGADALATDPSGPQGQIRARFNSNLGLNANCLPGSPFYLGLDRNFGTGIDLVTVLLHEFGHGLGFQTFTSGSTGAQINGLPSIWDHFMLDNTSGKLWTEMTDAERVVSALNSRRLVWTGANATAGAPSALIPGTPSLRITGANAGATAGTYPVGTASFGPLLTSTGVSGQLMPVVSATTAAGLTGPGCGPLTATDARAVNGNIALIDRGVCGFAVKVKNAQLAGARAVVIADNVAGGPPAGLGGADPTVTIPSLRITLADANALKARLTTRSRTTSGVIATLIADPSQLAGADTNGRVMLFTPNPLQSGSSLSHWDTSATPNLLMEPAINLDLLQVVNLPTDLTFPLLLDIGW